MALRIWNFCASSRGGAIGYPTVDTLGSTLTLGGPNQSKQGRKMQAAPEGTTSSPSPSGSTR